MDASTGCAFECSPTGGVLPVKRSGGLATRPSTGPVRSVGCPADRPVFRSSLATGPVGADPRPMSQDRTRVEVQEDGQKNRRCVVSKLGRL